MPNTAKYDKFRQAIKEQSTSGERAITAIYQGDPQNDPRKLWPLVLGSDTADQEVALCYQYGGYSEIPLEPHPSPKNFRCFKLARLSNVQKATYSEQFDPPDLKFKQVKKQTCVDNVDVYRQS